MDDDPTLLAIVWMIVGLGLIIMAVTLENHILKMMLVLGLAIAAASVSLLWHWCRR